MFGKINFKNLRENKGNMLFEYWRFNLLGSWQLITTMPYSIIEK